MLFPLYTRVRVPEGVHQWHAVYADKLVNGKLSVELTIPVIENGFDGVIVRTKDWSGSGHYREVDLRPNGEHTKIENPDTEETYMFLDVMIVERVTRL